MSRRKQAKPARILEDEAALNGKTYFLFILLSYFNCKINIKLDMKFIISKHSLRYFCIRTFHVHLLPWFYFYILDILFIRNYLLSLYIIRLYLKTMMLTCEYIFCKNNIYKSQKQGSREMQILLFVRFLAFSMINENF